MSVTFVPWGVRVAGAEPDSYFVPTVEVDDDEVLRRRSRRTRIAVMPSVINKSEQIERGSVEEVILPALEAI